MINRVRIRNFKSIAYADVDFTHLNFVVGRNGTGKSNLVDAINFLSELSTATLQTALANRGGVESTFRKTKLSENIRGGLAAALTRPSLRISVEFEFPESGHRARYTFELAYRISGRLPTDHLVVVRREQALVVEDGGRRHWFDRAEQRVRASDKFLNNLPSDFIGADSLALPFLGSFPNFTYIRDALRAVRFYSIDPGKLREFQDPDSSTQLTWDGSNAVNVLESLKKRDREALERVFELLSAITPGTISVSTMTAGRKKYLRFFQQFDKQNRFRFDAFNMSDGTLRALGLLLASYQVPTPEFIIVEQPEDSLHPGATAVIIDAIKERHARMQAVLTTHSPEVLDLFDASNDKLITTFLNEGATMVATLPPYLAQSIRDNLCTGGDLLRLRMLEESPSLLNQEHEQDFFEVLYR